MATDDDLLKRIKRSLGIPEDAGEQQIRKPIPSPNPVESNVVREPMPTPGIKSNELRQPILYPVRSNVVGGMINKPVASDLGERIQADITGRFGAPTQGLIDMTPITRPLQRISDAQEAKGIEADRLAQQALLNRGAANEFRRNQLLEGLATTGDMGIPAESPRGLLETRTAQAAETQASQAETHGFNPKQARFGELNKGAEATIPGIRNVNTGNFTGQVLVRTPEQLAEAAKEPSHIATGPNAFNPQTDLQEQGIQQIRGTTIQGQPRTANDVFTDVAPFLHSDAVRAAFITGAQARENELQKAQTVGEYGLASHKLMEEGLDKRAKIAAAARTPEEYKAIMRKTGGMEGAEEPFVWNARTGQELVSPEQRMGRMESAASQAATPEDMRKIVSGSDEQSIMNLYRRLKSTAPDKAEILRKLYGG